jgi:hypothetical protein
MNSLPEQSRGLCREFGKCFCSLKGDRKLFWRSTKALDFLELGNGFIPLPCSKPEDRVDLVGVRGHEH